MGWVDILRESKVAVDTIPLIYFVEEHPIYLQVVDTCFEAIERGEFSVITSTVSLLEGLVHSIRNNDAELIEKYHNLLFDTEGISTIDLTQAIAKEARSYVHFIIFVRQMLSKWPQLPLREHLFSLQMIGSYHLCRGCKRWFWMI